MKSKTKTPKPKKPTPGAISIKADGPTIIDPNSLKEVPLDIPYAVSQMEYYDNSNPQSSLGRKIKKWKDNLRSEYKLPEIVAEMQRECRMMNGNVYRKIGSWAHLINMVIMSQIVIKNQADDKAKKAADDEQVKSGKVVKYE